MKPPNVALFLAAMGLAACSSSSTPRRGASSEPDAIAPARIDVVQSAQQRDDNPQLSESERDILSASQLSFAVDFYHAVRKRPEGADRDILLSPHSVSIALAMTYAGARDETAAEMKQALHFELPEDRLHTGLNYLDLALASRGAGAKGKDGKPFRLNVTNSIWGQQGSVFEAPFLDTLAVHYGAGLNVVDFVAESEASRLAINDWVEEKTEDRIKELLPKGIIDDRTRMVLVNAVYFNAAWALSFDPANTQPGPFIKADGTMIQVPMMNALATRPYAVGDGYEAVEMAYEGEALAMLVIAPARETFASFEASLTGAKVQEILASLQATELKLSFPKLKVEGAFALKDPLKNLGMRRVFEPDDADLSGISRTMRLYVKDVVHKTFAEIGETGTEAAASTAVVVSNSSTAVFPGPPEMKVDRPFIMAIIDRPTKTLLFLGRVLEPKL